MPADFPDDLLDLPSAAKLIGCSSHALRKWILAGKLTGYRIVSRWRVSRADVLDLVEPFTPADAKTKRAAALAGLPLSKREIERRNREVDAKLRAIGVR